MKLENFRTLQDPETIPDDWYWERIRNWRNSQLRESDWTQLPDSSANTAAWSAYRQELRDFPNTAALNSLVFPVAP